MIPVKIKIDPMTFDRRFLQPSFGLTSAEFIEEKGILLTDLLAVRVLFKEVIVHPSSLLSG